MPYDSHVSRRCCDIYKRKKIEGIKTSNMNAIFIGFRRYERFPSAPWRDCNNMHVMIFLHFINDISNKNFCAYAHIWLIEAGDKNVFHRRWFTNILPIGSNAYCSSQFFRASLPMDERFGESVKSVVNAVVSSVHDPGEIRMPSTP